VITRLEHGERLAKLRIPTDDPRLNRHTVSVSTPDDRVKHTSRRWRRSAVLPCRAGRPGSAAGHSHAAKTEGPDRPL
jgi:hypothetical protein